MELRKKTISTLLLSVSLMMFSVTAQEPNPSLEQDLDISYKESVVRLNDYMSRNWNKKPNYFSDGITYTAEINDKTALFKVRRYNSDIQHIEPFLLIKIARKPDAGSRLIIWEREAGKGVLLNLGKTVSSLLKKCKQGCPLT